jgi:hypothetical protein
MSSRSGVLLRYRTVYSYRLNIIRCQLQTVKGKTVINARCICCVHLILLRRPYLPRLIQHHTCVCFSAGRAMKQVVSPPETMKQRLFIAAKAFLLHEQHTSYAGCADFHNVPKTSLKRMISEFRGTDAHMALLKMGSPSLGHWHCLKFRQHPKFTCRPGQCTCRPDQYTCRLWAQLQGNASHSVYGSL